MTHTCSTPHKTGNLRFAQKYTVSAGNIEKNPVGCRACALLLPRLLVPTLPRVFVIQRKNEEQLRKYNLLFSIVCYWRRRGYLHDERVQGKRPLQPGWQRGVLEALTLLTDAIKSGMTMTAPFEIWNDNILDLGDLPRSRQHHSVCRKDQRHHRWLVCMFG